MKVIRTEAERLGVTGELDAAMNRTRSLPGLAWFVTAKAQDGRSVSGWLRDDGDPQGWSVHAADPFRGL